MQRVRECRVESAESARMQRREEGAQCMMRSQFERAESECRECENAESECRGESAESARVQRRECNVRVQSRECRECRGCENAESRVQRECEGTESRGGTTVHDESTVREYRIQRRESRVKDRECRESARVQSRECRECENAKSRVQRIQGHRVERREQSAR